jgi:hydrogenase nickel incorporation protein HypB
MELEVERKVLEANDEIARQNLKEFREKGLFVINLMSSPGAGKTTLLERTAERLRGELNLAVIEGDIQSTHDADKIAALGVPAVQINTRGGCHLEADAVGRAARALDLDQADILIIENVGNLVCPAEFSLGEAAKVTLLSTPEGEDKPLKYPLMFHLSRILIINKMDLLAYLPFNLDKAREEVLKLNPEIGIFEISALKGQGLEGWLDWLRAGAARAKERAG